MRFFKGDKRVRRFQDIERDLPTRLRKEPKAGENPLKRPYPAHARDIDVLYSLLSSIPRDIPTEFAKRDVRTAARPQGVLYFHMLDIQNLSLCPEDFIPGAPFSIYVEYECQGVIKCSYPVWSHHHAKIRIDHFSHFGAEVSETRNDEANDFVLHIYAFQNPEKHCLIGSQLLHLYDFVRDIHGIATVDILDDLSYYMGRVTFEFAWCYGAYGYGHSNQLRNTKNPVLDSVCHSLFPRIAPNSSDLIEKKFRVRVPRRLRLINLHSLIVRPSPVEEKKKKVTKKSKKAELIKNAEQLLFRRVKFLRGRPNYVALNLNIHQKFMENDFNQAYGEFITKRNRRERLMHLTRMMEGRLRDRIEDHTATGLFHPIKDAWDSRVLLNLKKPLACPPGYLEQYTHHKLCPPTDPVKLTEKDEQFISKITSAPRFSGYLASVFGFATKPSKVQPVEHWKYHVDAKAFLGGGEKETDALSFFQKWKYFSRKFLYKAAIWCRDVWEFIFPSDTSKAELILPEISVTLPSPADSTTEFYSHCVQEKVYPKVDDLTQAKRLTVKFVRGARKEQVGDTTDSEVEDEEQVKADIKAEIVDDEGGWETEKELEELQKKVKDKRKKEHGEKGKTTPILDQSTHQGILW